MSCSKPKPEGTCVLQAATFETKGSSDLWSQDGVYPFRDQMIPGWWPRIYRISFNGNEADASADGFDPAPTQLRFGFRTGKAQAVTFGVPPLPVDMIYSAGLPTATLHDSPTVLNTNFGAGWLVPFWDGLPAEFFITVFKARFVYAATASILWGYEEIGGDIG